MPKKITIIILLFFTITCFTYSVSDFSLKKLDGSTYKLSDSIGKKVIIIDFWATWCKPCRKMLKRLQKINAEYKDGLEVIAISVDSTSALSKVESYVKSKKFTFQVLLDSENKVSNLLNPSGKIPFTMIINKDGKLVFTHSGYMTGFEKILRKKLKKWL